MNWLLQRYSDDKTCTQGLFFEKVTPKPIWHSHTLEDEHRDVKVKGDTRVPAKIYELVLAKFTREVKHKTEGFKAGGYLNFDGKVYTPTSAITQWVIDSVLWPDKFMLDELTPLTKKHRETYNKNEAEPWFFHHIMLKDVPGFTGVYFHSGVNETHTDACILLMDTINNNQIDNLNASRSLQAVKRFYQKTYTHLVSGKRAWCEIRDENYLLV